MSRIDEALRRAGTPLAASIAAATERDEVFASPWVAAEGATDAMLREEIAEPSSASLPASRRVMTSPADGFTQGWRELLVSPGVDPALVEQFRRLAAALLRSQRSDARVKVLMVTSAVPGEGKTLTALNLAFVLSQSYRRRVLLIDGDLRRPRISEAANLSVSDGLNESLRGSEDRKLSLVPLTETLTLLPAGRPDPDPLSGLTSSRMRRLLDEAAERFDWVIIDAPPVNTAADAGLLCAIVDAVLLVIRAGQTRYAAVERAVASLGRDRIFGVVMNGVERQTAASGGTYAGHDALDALG